MDSRALAAMLSSLTPHLLSLLLISLPSPNHPTTLSLLLSHFLSASHSAASSLSLLPRKRKHTSNHHSPAPKLPRLTPLDRVDSFRPQPSTTHVPNAGEDAPPDRVNSVNSFIDTTHIPNLDEASPEPVQLSKLGQLGELALVNSFGPQSNTTHVTTTGEDGPEPVQLGRLARVDSFKLCFKMSSSTFEWLAGLLEPLLDCRDPAGPPLNLPAETRLGIGLFRLATGAGFSEISNRFGVSELVSRFCVKQLCRVLCTNFRFWVSFPKPSELISPSEIPNCCGVIATTTFELSKNDKIRKNSIKGQVVVDSSCRILSIFAGFCGNKSDFSVLKRSTLYQDVEDRRVLDGPPIYIHNVAVPQYFIGDGDYPLLPWLITPFIDPSKGSCEDDFNSGLGSIRGSLIRAIASLRSWGVLSKPIEGEVKAAVAYIGACSILHNGLLIREDYSALSDEVESLEGFKGGSLVDSSVGSEGSVIRRVLATRAN